jgi:hypothetical protein
VRARWRLIEAILALSHADTWEEARLEWSLAHVYFADEPGTCLCGHAPIIEHCVLVNTLNGHEVVVGNECVTRFLGIGSKDIFAGLRRVIKNPRAALSPAAVAHAYQEKWINDWERKFCLDTAKNRRPSAKQLATRLKINRRVLTCLEGARCR